MDLINTTPRSVSAPMLGIVQHGRVGKYEYDCAFDTIHRPGAAAPFSGIYRCTTCGWDEVFVSNTTLPPQNHHTHAPGLGNILWRLSAYARDAANAPHLKP